MKREKIKAIKAVGVDEKGRLKSLYFRDLRQYNLSLSYSTKRSTPKNHVCFAFASLETCYLRDSDRTDIQIWECEGYEIEKNGWWEEMQRLSSSIGLSIDEHIFLTEVKLLRRIR